MSKLTYFCISSLWEDLCLLQYSLQTSVLSSKFVKPHYIPAMNYKTRIPSWIRDPRSPCHVGAIHLDANPNPDSLGYYHWFQQMVTHSEESVMMLTEKKIALNLQRTSLFLFYYYFCSFSVALEILFSYH